MMNSVQQLPTFAQQTSSLPLPQLSIKQSIIYIVGENSQRVDEHVQFMLQLFSNTFHLRMQNPKANTICRFEKYVKYYYRLQNYNNNNKNKIMYRLSLSATTDYKYTIGKEPIILEERIHCGKLSRTKENSLTQATFLSSPFLHEYRKHLTCYNGLLVAMHRQTIMSCKILVTFRARAYCNPYLQHQVDYTVLIKKHTSMKLHQNQHDNL